MKAKLLILLLIVLGYVSCLEDRFDVTANSENLIGYWVNPTFQDSIIILDKVSKLRDNDYGIAFMNDGKFIERKNSGWCGTPPIAYGDFNGYWTVKDSLVSINVDYWGGKADYKWKIVSVTNDHLRVFVKEQKYDHSSGE